MKKIIVDCSTGIINEIDLTKEEEKDMLNRQKDPFQPQESDTSKTLKDIQKRLTALENK